MDHARLATILAAAARREYGAQGADLDEDGEHIYIDGLDERGEHVAFRYWVPPEVWEQLDAWERSGADGPPPRIVLRPPSARPLDR